jgi:hypothetical protein
MLDADLYVELHKVLQSVVTTDSYSLSFTIQPFGAAAVGKGEELGGNSLGIAPLNQACKVTTYLSFDLPCVFRL